MQKLSTQTRPRRRNASAVAALVVLSLTVVGFSAASGTGSQGANRSESSAPSPWVAELDTRLTGSATGWAERCQPWLEAAAHATPEALDSALMGLDAALALGPPEIQARSATLIGALMAVGRLRESVRRRAQGMLIGRLSARTDTGDRWSVGADVVAARALDLPLGTPEDREQVRTALAQLAQGPAPHPCLAVRVECAATALALSGETAHQGEVTAAVTRFLLAVLRAETPDQAKSPRTWPRITTLAWVKTRSAETLALWTGTKNLFRPDGPWAHQTKEADRFESLLTQ